MKKDIAKLAVLAVSVLVVVQIGFCANTTKVSIAEPATGEQINWQVISSGGTEGSSTSFRLMGTVGQTAVGTGSSDSYGLSHGYWQDFAGGCCIPPLRGNVDYDPGDNIDISDLVYLVDYMFTGGDPPPCFEEADMNCDGSIDISDLVHLVDYMFTGGPPPCRCDCADCP